MPKKLKDTVLPKEIRRKMWAYYAPDGYIQVRSIGETRKESREFICYREYEGSKKITHEYYEKRGYTLQRIFVCIGICSNRIRH